VSTEVSILDGLQLSAIRETREAIAPHIRSTPLIGWHSNRWTDKLGPNADVRIKLELWQVTGTFKARGALAVVSNLDEHQRSRGLIAVSAGNHALAVAHAGRTFGADVKVVMPENADRARVDGCQQLGATVIFRPDMHDAFATCERMAEDEGRVLIHPFEGAGLARGTGTLGLEIVEQFADVEVVVVPIGGGGLCAGVASAIRQLHPTCTILGVEPTGADSMYRSLEAGRPEAIDAVRTIADSLGAPRAMPFSFEACRRTVDRVVLVEDQELVAAMRWIADDLKLMVEPACAATTAAALGPAAEFLAGKRTCLIACGSNIERKRWMELVDSD
jgi:threonine dehydratase